MYLMEEEIRDLDFGQAKASIRDSFFLIDHGQVSVDEKKSAIETLKKECDQSILNVSQMTESYKQMENTLRDQISEFNQSTRVQFKQCENNETDLNATLGELEEEQIRITERNRELSEQFDIVEEQLKLLAMELHDTEVTLEQPLEFVDDDFSIEDMKLEIAEAADSNVDICNTVNRLERSLIQSDAKAIQTRIQLLKHTESATRIRNQIEKESSEHLNFIEGQTHEFNNATRDQEMLRGVFDTLQSSLVDLRSKMRNESEKAKQLDREEKRINRRMEQFSADNNQTRSNIKVIANKLVKCEGKLQELHESQMDSAQKLLQKLTRVRQESHNVREQIAFFTQEHKQATERAIRMDSLMNELVQKCKTEDTQEASFKRRMNRLEQIEIGYDREVMENEQKLESLQLRLEELHSQIRNEYDVKHCLDLRSVKLRDLPVIDIPQRQFRKLTSKVMNEVNDCEKLKQLIFIEEQKLTQQKMEESEILELMTDLTETSVQVQKEILAMQKRRIFEEKEFRSDYSMEFLQLKGQIAEKKSAVSRRGFNCGLKRANLAHVSKEIHAQTCGNDVVVMKHGRQNASQTRKYTKTAEKFSSYMSNLKEFVNEIEFAKKRFEFARSEFVQESILRDWLSTIDRASHID